MRTLLGILAVVGAGVLVLPLLLLSHSEVAHYWLREASYNHIAHRIKDVASSEHRQVELATGFFYLNEMDPRPPFPIVDHTVHTDLTRGLGRCDQRVNGLITVLDKLGLDGRFLIFDCHTVAEIYTGNDTMIVDPTENVFWQKTPENNSESFPWNGHNWLAVQFNSKVISDYKYASVSNCGVSRINEILSKRKSLSRNVFDGLIGFYSQVLGRPFLHILVKWMDFLGHLEGEKLFNGVLGIEEMTIGMNRKARVFELLEFQNCGSDLPCFWSADLSEFYLKEAEFIRARRFAKSKRLTAFQALFFTE